MIVSSLLFVELCQLLLACRYALSVVPVELWSAHCDWLSNQRYLHSCGQLFETFSSRPWCLGLELRSATFDVFSLHGAVVSPEPLSWRPWYQQDGAVVSSGGRSGSLASGVDWGRGCEWPGGYRSGL